MSGFVRHPIAVPVAARSSAATGDVVGAKLQKI
jgi:hypothetical protein